VSAGYATLCRRCPGRIDEHAGSSDVMDKNRREQYTGCLLGGAVGDALGWPVEFSGFDEIVRDYGAEGIRGLSRAGSILRGGDIGDLKSRG